MQAAKVMALEVEQKVANANVFAEQVRRSPYPRMNWLVTVLLSGAPDEVESEWAVVGALG